ncbi:hypothetical protein KX928_02310 [Roseobacter sp. YSTF-M11]|uniref:Uncharacterized protein n=1 Tax=Roseobacter insulae TaxID=2859783 RepID=A0A9X1FRY6_9RHOB|nr:hypothetical protein [Roseobacter insulae]MBW4706610.1 hypothetical protein [Roseobacter insulae]
MSDFMLNRNSTDDQPINHHVVQPLGPDITAFSFALSDPGPEIGMGFSPSNLRAIDFGRKNVFKDTSRSWKIRNDRTDLNAIGPNPACTSRNRRVRMLSYSPSLCSGLFDLRK